MKYRLLHEGKEVELDVVTVESPDCLLVDLGRTDGERCRVYAAVLEGDVYSGGQFPTIVLPRLFDKDIINQDNHAKSKERGCTSPSPKRGRGRPRGRTSR